MKRSLAPLLLVTALVALAPAAFAQRDRSLLAADGYLRATSGGRCLVLYDHDGRVLSLVGRSTYSLRPGDHVRLVGRFVRDDRCPGQAFAVTRVEALWADDRHRTTYFDHLVDGSFDRRGGHRRYDRGGRW